MPTFENALINNFEDPPATSFPGLGGPLIKPASSEWVEEGKGSKYIHTFIKQTNTKACKIAQRTEQHEFSFRKKK